VVDKDGAHAEFVELPGGSTGLLTKAYKRTEADQLAYRVGTGLFSECRSTSAMRAEAARKARRCVLRKTGRNTLVTGEPGRRG
jgi:hypothetical protein